MKQVPSSIIRIGYVLSCSILLLCIPGFSNPLRLRRQSSTNYTIDTLVVVDDIMYTRFQQWLDESPLEQRFNQNLNTTLRQYVSLVAHQANDRLATMTTNLGYQLSLRVVDIRLNLNILANASKNAAGEVPSDDALVTFRNWVQSSGQDQDHSVLLTGHNLSSSVLQAGEVNKGRSYTGKMCDTSGLSSSVIQDNGGFQSVFFLVHELGHSLGADHDLNTPCKPEDRYIMSSSSGDIGQTATNADHPWYFSNCSIQAISSLVSTPLVNNCLSSSSLTPIPEFTATSNYASGQLYKADAQCQMIYGNKSRVCYSTTMTTLENICVSMYCQQPVTGVCMENRAAEGTSCGNKKWCKLGRCVPSDSAPAIDLNDCPTGDSVEPFNYRECSVEIKANPRFCYNQTVSNVLCCASCKKARRNSDVCPYGDVQKGCVKANCGKDANYTKTCCETCNLAPNQCQDVGSIDGVSCSDRVKMNNRQGCYDSAVAESCCKTCSNFSFKITECQYGDRVLNGTCTAAKTDKSRCSGQTKIDCCGSCNTATSTTVYLSLLFLSVVLALCML